MLKEPISRPTNALFSGGLAQAFAVVLCVAFSLTMILNNQLGGEAMWFWYATIFHSGAKLYSQLHTALQPVFVLETDVWMQMVGHKIMATETLSLLHILGLCFSLYLVLRDSDWKDWHKACVLFGAFCLTVSGHSYRFDDYHVLAEAFIFFALAALLRIARAETVKRQMLMVALLGLICGLTITTRLTDGVALLVASAIIIPFLATRKSLQSIGLLFVITAATVLVVVRLTGDTFHAYLYSSVIRAAGSKGGTGSIFAAPFMALRNALPMLWTTSKRVLAVLAVIISIGPLVVRYWKAGVRYIFLLQLLASAAVFLLVPHVRKEDLLHGSLISVAVLLLTSMMYVLPLVVLVRLIQAKRSGEPWDTRDALVLLPLAEWASYSAGAAAEPLTNYYAPVAMLLILVPVLQPFRRHAIWANVSFAMVMTLLALSSISGKVITPYSWQNYRYSPMFVNREWYHHPVYGKMYIDKDLLKFSEMVCSDIGEKNPVGKGLGPGNPQLLSLPYPFPNYFCDTPPWHDYVQTFFDTSTRATIEHLIQELKTAPPEFIVYQRQLNIMRGAERLYNHGAPLAQRDLDKLIFEKISTGQWKLLEKSDYLTGSDMGEPSDTGWYVVQTHP